MTLRPGIVFSGAAPAVAVALPAAATPPAPAPPAVTKLERPSGDGPIVMPAPGARTGPSSWDGTVRWPRLE
jgi:hypothetical protein